MLVASGAIQLNSSLGVSILGTLFIQGTVIQEDVLRTIVRDEKSMAVLREVINNYVITSASNDSIIMDTGT